MGHPSAKIGFDLLRNAEDSIDRAIDLIAFYDEEVDDTRRLKQAILSVAQGIELLLKERLRRIHPAIMLENIDKYPSLSARTVTVEIAVKRLRSIAEVEIDDEDERLLRTLRNTRNAIEHFAWSTTKSEADEIVGQALGFAVHFARYELEFEFFDYGDVKRGIFEALEAGNDAFSKAYYSREEKRMARRRKASGKPDESPFLDEGDLPF